MDYENETAWVRKMLYPGENLLWTGRPQKGQLKDTLLELLVILALFLITCVIPISFKRIIPDSSIFHDVLLYAPPLGLFGLIHIIGAITLPNHTRYALTSQRLILYNGKTRRVLNLEDLPQMTVRQNDDGSGSIRFEEKIQTAGPGAKSGSGNFDALLKEIPNVILVESTIRTAVDQAKAALRRNASSIRTIKQ